MGEAGEALTKGDARPWGLKILTGDPGSSRLGWFAVWDNVLSFGEEFGLSLQSEKTPAAGFWDAWGLALAVPPIPPAPAPHSWGLPGGFPGTAKA